MKKNKSKEAANSLAVLGGVFFVLGILVLGSYGPVGIAAQKKPVDLYAEETDIHDLTKTTNVEAEIYMTLDYFATETTTTTRDGNLVSQDVDHYFIIPAFSGDDTYFLGIRVEAEDVGTFMTISDETYAYVMGDMDEWGETTMLEQGVLKDMDDEMYGYLVEWFEQSGWYEDESDISEYVLPLYLDPANMGAARTWFRIACALVLAGIVLLVLAIVKFTKAKKKAKEQAGIVFQGTAYSKEVLSTVNAFVQQNDTPSAVQELCRITGISQEEAEQAVAAWDTYYR